MLFECLSCCFHNFGSRLPQTSTDSPSSREMSSLEKVSPGIKSRFFSHKSAWGHPERHPMTRCTRKSGEDLPSKRIQLMPPVSTIVSYQVCLRIGPPGKCDHYLGVPSQTFRHFQISCWRFIPCQ